MFVWWQGDGGLERSGLEGWDLGEGRRLRWSTPSISSHKTRSQLACHTKHLQAPLLTLNPGPTWIWAVAETN